MAKYMRKPLVLETEEITQAVFEPKFIPSGLFNEVAIEYQNGAWQVVIVTITGNKKIFGVGDFLTKTEDGCIDGHYRIAFLKEFELIQE